MTLLMKPETMSMNLMPKISRMSPPATPEKVEGYVEDLEWL